MQLYGEKQQIDVVIYIGTLLSRPKTQLQLCASKGHTARATTPAPEVAHWREEGRRGLDLFTSRYIRVYIKDNIYNISK